VAKEGQEPQRSGIGPVRVIDGDHHRRARREPGNEPVQPVKQREARIRRGNPHALGTIAEHHPRETCGAREQLLAVRVGSADQ
jgi:hypothetical protein